MEFSTFKYRGNFWKFYLIAIPILSCWFVTTAIIQDYIGIHFIILFLIGAMLTINIISRFRFRNDGIIKIADNLLIHESRTTSTWQITAQLKIDVYYVYNYYWIDMFGRLGGYFRYQNLSYTAFVSEDATDRLIINGETYYIKIRSKSEAEQFENLIDLLFDKEVNIKVYSTTSDNLLKEEFSERWKLKGEKSP